jgi:hypothetical protein
VLEKIILEAILKLEGVGAQVLCVVCDGAKPNKSFWRLLGLSGKLGDVNNKVLKSISINIIELY